MIIKLLLFGLKLLLFGLAFMCSADVETYTNTIKSNKDGRFENI